MSECDPTRGLRDGDRIMVFRRLNARRPVRARVLNATITNHIFLWRWNALGGLLGFWFDIQLAEIRHEGVWWARGWGKDIADALCAARALMKETV